MKRTLLAIALCALCATSVCAQNKLPVRLEIGAGLAPLFLMGGEDSFDVPYKADAYVEARYDLGEYFDVGLKAFKEQFDDEFSDWPEEWLDAARKMDATLLADGLKFLAAQRIESVIENSEDIQVLFGRMDQDVTPAMTLRLKEFLPKATFKERPKSGHWPPMMLF